MIDAPGPARTAPRGDSGSRENQERATYLREVCQLLWPSPAQVLPVARTARRKRSATATDGRQLIVLPSMKRPRLIVPAARRPAAAAVRRYGEPASLRAYLGTRGLWLALAVGAGQPFLGDCVRVSAPAGSPAIESYLSAQLGHEVELSMHLGTARANRKPVLQLLSSDGRTVGFAKIGTNALTRRLVRAEERSLTELRRVGLRSVAVPSVLHFGTWQDLDILVLAALPVWRRRRPLRAGELPAAMGEVARAAGATAAPLTAGRYWKGLLDRVENAADRVDRAALGEALARLAERSGTAELTFGAWHGDWTPWNMASTRQGLLVWDWERYAVGVPIGFDVLHCWLQTQVSRGAMDPATAAAACLVEAADLLRPLGTDADSARLTAILYLAELSARYLEDRQAEVNPRLAPGRWLIPALSTGIARL
jgi:hypothetical protein